MNSQSRYQQEEERRRLENLELLRTYGIHGSEEDLKRLSEIRARDQLEIIAAVLRDHHDGQAAQYDTVEVLEEVLQQAIQDGQLEKAQQLYFGRAVFMRSGGGYVNLGHHQGRYQTGLQLGQLLSAAQAAGTDNPRWVPESDAEYERALYLVDLGELAQAETILLQYVDRPALYYPGPIGKSLYSYPARLNLCDVLMLRGRLSEAQAIAEVIANAYEDRHYPEAESLTQRAAIGEYVGSFRVVTGYNPLAWRAQLRALQGRTAEALADFKRAEDFQQKKFGRLCETREMLISARKSSGPATVPALLGYPAIRYAILLIRLGCLGAAQRILSYNQARAAHAWVRLPAQAAQAAVALSDVCRLQGDYAAAAQHLDDALAWSAETGHADITCQARLSQARWQLAQNDTAQAHAMATDALKFAQLHGFALYEIDGRLLLGRLAFMEHDWETARTQAENALERAADPDCRYAWAHSSALHLLAEMQAHPAYQPLYRQDRREVLADAQRLINNAIAIRTRSRDPRVSNSRKVLIQIMTQGA